MPFRKSFLLADELVKHLTTLAATEKDLQVLAVYSGFVSVSAVTVFELALRGVFIRFATQRDPAFGAFMEASLARVNGRIRLADIQDQYLKRLGGRSSARFARLIDRAELLSLRKSGRSVKSSYSNLLTWRHEFAHQGRPPSTTTFSEACDSYELGKVVIDCLHRSLR